MKTQERTTDTTDLGRLGESLLETARGSSSQRAAHSVHGGTGMLRQSLMALTAGARLAEHDSPPEATMQVLSGRLCLIGAGRQWELGAGEFIAIPPERHSVTAVEDVVFLLTIRRDIDPVAAEEMGARA